jgi:hypothetical protein
MIKAYKETLTEESAVFQARTKLTKLALDIASSKDLDSVVKPLLWATKIRLFLKALDYKNYLTAAQRNKLLYALIDVSNIYSAINSPVLEKTTVPDQLVNTYVKVRR